MKSSSAIRTLPPPAREGVPQPEGGAGDEAEPGVERRRPEQDHDALPSPRGLLERGAHQRPADPCPWRSGSTPIGPSARTGVAPTHARLICTWPTIVPPSSATKANEPSSSAPHVRSRLPDHAERQALERERRAPVVGALRAGCSCGARGAEPARRRGALSGSCSTQPGTTEGSATITSCAMRSPFAIVTASVRSRFTTATISSPR